MNHYSTRIRNAIALGSFLLFFSQAQADPFPFSVLSFNTWGVPFAVKDTFRYAETMGAIEKMNPDFVFLEEVFSAKGKRNFHSELYPYEVNGPRAFPKLVPAGIRLLSKYPVLRSAKMAYWQCQQDDCLSKKGALLALVQLPNGKTLNLVGTHLNARGTDKIRKGQIDQLKLFIDEFAEPGVPILISGDFNYNAESPLYTYGLELLEMKDAWVESRGIQDPGITYDTVLNRYAHDYSIRYNFPLTQERIDFVLLKSAETAKLKVLSSNVIFKDAPFYSDHYGLTVTLSLDD